ncbi:MAG: hypothetical protein ACERKS_12555 [Candidatus Bathyarchaeota archaeon]
MTKVSMRIAYLIAITLGLMSCGASEPSDIVEITFDGNGCSVTGPVELQTGREYSLHLNNISDIRITIGLYQPWSGYSWKDALELGEPGVNVPGRSWYDQIPESAPFEFEDGLPVTYKYIVDTEGEYHVWAEEVGSSKVAWPCVLFTATEKPPE